MLYDIYDTGYRDYFTRKFIIEPGRRMAIEAARNNSMGRYGREAARRLLGESRENMHRTSLGGIMEDFMKDVSWYITHPQVQVEGEAVCDEMLQKMKQFEGLYNGTEGNILSIREVNLDLSNFLMNRLNAIQAEHEAALSIWTSSLEGMYVEDMKKASAHFDTVLSKMNDFSVEISNTASMSPKDIANMTPGGTLDKLSGVMKLILIGGFGLMILPVIIKKLEK